MIFLSDCHFSHKLCQAAKLHSFLFAHPEETEIVLVGDIIECFSRRSWSYAERYVLQKLLGYSKVTLLPGNHDAVFRRLVWGISKHHNC